MCPTGATGLWKVERIGFPGITAATDESEKRFRGTVEVSDDHVKFGSVRCEVDHIERQAPDEHEPQFLYVYECKGPTSVPAFMLGPSCRHIQALHDGAVYELKRLKDRPVKARRSTAPAAR